MKSKKHILGLIFLISILICFLKSAKINYDTKIGNYMLLNIEALAQNENGDYTDCYFLGSLDCPHSNLKVKYIVTKLGDL